MPDQRNTTRHDQPQQLSPGAPQPTPPIHEPLLQSLISGSLGPLTRLAESLNRSLDDVTRWIEDPANRRQLDSLITLLDAQTQLIVSQQRLVAVARLIEIADTAPGFETRRRACADLLHLRLIDPDRPDRQPAEPVQHITHADPDIVRELLEELGRDDLLDESPTDQRLHVGAPQRCADRARDGALRAHRGEPGKDPNVPGQPPSPSRAEGRAPDKGGANPARARMRSPDAPMPKPPQPPADADEPPDREPEQKSKNCGSVYLTQSTKSA